MTETIKKYNLVAEGPLSTVVSSYEPGRVREAAYQSEAQLEEAFIKQLEAQAYERVVITDEGALVANLRKQIECLNDFVFTDTEWERFFRGEIANPNQRIEDKAKIIQEDYIRNLIREDGSTKNIYLLKKDAIHDNILQVTNQYATEEGRYANRYDVTVLVNGLPLVHIELKRRGVAIQEAFNQINRYQRDSFWAASGLFEFVQIFVISNGTHTKYYSNTTRNKHVKETVQGASKKGKRASNSFEFTSWWADANNKPIMELLDFAKTFFAKHALLNILTKYCVFTTDQDLLVMRPYQIVATERIINRIEISTNSKKLGTIDAGGYIWHTTGSGKTLTSFKAAQLASRMSVIDKVLFVVDRKDLDYQTMKEYDKFASGAANSNTSTSVLKKQLGDPNARIIITTIQKLDKFIRGNAGHAIFDGHIVIIFDECHRSQFGDMHKAITKAFNNYHLFGFTGTPITATNATSGGDTNLRTTAQAFGIQLHTYTIVDAIADKNVLPFKIEYISTFHEAENVEDKKVSDIDRERALADPRRIGNIVKYIREHFDQKTKRIDGYYSHKMLVNVEEVASAKHRGRVEEIRSRVSTKGFNSIFAVSSIDAAKQYYAEFQKQMLGLPSDQRLRVGIIYSFGVNEEEADGVVDENSEDTSGLDASSRDFLEKAIVDYNAIYGTSYDTSAEKFQNYYKDVSLRMKNRQIDVLIVVNMFLTGFDATTLNTLWVDKNLRYHGLLQAYSRTNRILNSVKTFGNIVCFRNLEKATNDSIALFGDKEAAGVVLLRSFADYFDGYTDNGKEVVGYRQLVNELCEKFPVGERIESESAQKEFVKLYGSILRARNILTTFDEFEERDLLTVRDVQDYHSLYIDLYQQFRKGERGEKEDINDDIVFEMELIKQVEINIDYILRLIQKYHTDHLENKEILINVNRAIDSSVELRNKKDLINQFVALLDPHSNVESDWHTFVAKKKEEELEEIIVAEGLDPEGARTFVKNAFRDGGVSDIGTELGAILPPMSLFSPTGERTKKKEIVFRKIVAFFERYFSISSSVN